jgi:hypothetical protein
MSQFLWCQHWKPVVTLIDSKTKKKLELKINEYYQKHEV